MAKTYAKKVGGKYVNPKTAPTPTKAAPVPSKAAPAPTPAESNPFADIYRNTKSGQPMSTPSTPTYSASRNNDPNQFIPGGAPSLSRTSPNTISTKPINMPQSSSTSMLRPEERKTMELDKGPTIPQRLENVGYSLNAALNPFSSDKNVVGNMPTGTKLLTGYIANNPFSAALAGTGLVGLIKGVAGAIYSATGKTAVQKAAQVGVKKIVTTTNLKTGVSKTIEINTVTIEKTSNWFIKLAAGAANPAMVASSLMAAIGSYPFAGFIKEEALQTLSYGVTSAMRNGDIASAQIAIDFQKQILEPDIWEQIKNGIPFANVLNELDNFYEAAKTKLAIDEKINADLKIQIETGETEDKKWERIHQERIQQEKENIDYYNAERVKLGLWEADARKEALEAQNDMARKNREEEAEFWRQEKEKQYKREAEDREATAKFWEAYRKRIQKMQEDQRPSKLNFGIV